MIVDLCRSDNMPKLSMVFKICPTRYTQSHCVLSINLLPPMNTWIENGRSVFPADKFEVISPDELKYNPVGALIRDSFLLILFQLVVNETRRQASRCKPSTKFGGIVL